MRGPRLIVMGLLSKAETFDHGRIARFFLLFQIVQQPTPLADHHQKTATRREVFLMFFQMLGQIGDPLGQNGDLDLG